MTALFAPTPGPRVFALPPGADFTAALVAGLNGRLAGHPPEALARVEIWVNTQRARRALHERLRAGPARLLPRVRVVTELADDPATPAELAEPITPLRRKLDLARLVRALIEAEPGVADEAAALDLAESLAELFDEMQGEGVDPARLGDIDAGDHALHWRRSLAFLEILRAAAAPGVPQDAQGRMRAAALAWEAAWRAAPPDHPVLVAGSTGSRGATRIFMRAVARLPQGALILPGYDALAPEAIWARLAKDDAGVADHPQTAFRRLAAETGFDPASAPPWIDAPAPAPERNALVSLALRPAPVTDQWRAEGDGLRSGLVAALRDLAWIEAPDPRTEARAIALRLRGALEAGDCAALVTPDRTLARRVTAELDRWGLIPDDSAGRPAGLTPPGVFLRSVAAALGADLAPDALLALLKHPLCSSAPGARRPHLRRVAALEIEALRGGAALVDWPRLRGWAAARGAADAAWIGWLEATLAPLSAAATAPLAGLAALHRRAAEILAAGPEAAAASQLWERDAGEAALALIETLQAAAEPGDVLAPRDYAALLRAELSARNVPEEAEVTDAGVAIWGALEARVQSADLVILGGLNEGVWPRLPDPDPWLSRDLRRAVGLPDRETRIGLSAHDFQQAMGARSVALSRSIRDAEAPTVASRWLLRLENLLAGLGPEGPAALEAARARGARLLAEAALLDAGGPAVPPAPRPSPRPPAEARPAALSVTQIETLVRDPYAVYARKVLDLARLEPLGASADALARGSALHAALEGFVAATLSGAPHADATDFLARVRPALAAAAPTPAARELWIARIARAADWFLEGEAERRAFAEPVALEARGRRALDGLARPFDVTAKADRIDRDPAGVYAIYDYKSGGVPSAAQARTFHLQLPLEAAIAAAGGFAGLAPGPTRRLQLIGLGARRTLDIDPDDVDATWDRLRALIALYQDPATGFTARLRPALLAYASDYDHLSRCGEWSDADAPVGEDLA